MHADSLQQGLTGKTSGLFNTLWPTLFWLVIMAIVMTLVRPGWQSPETAHKGQIMPPEPPASTATVQPCR